MEAIINDFKSFPLWKKILIIAGFPLVLVFLFVRGASAISALFNSADRARTDQQSAQLDQKIQATANEVSQEQGKVDQIETDKKEAIDHEKTDDPTSFYNDRFKPKP